MTKFQAADTAIAAYDAYVFASFGRSFDAEKADTLAAVCVVECEIAAKDRTEPASYRKDYANNAKYFRAILA